MRRLLCCFILSLQLFNADGQQVVLDNPTSFMNPFQFEITFECLQELDDGKISVVELIFCWRYIVRITVLQNGPPLPSLSPKPDLEWKIIYVGSAHDSHQDQVLDEVLVGPVPVGLNKFVLQADAPSIDKIPHDEVLGVTVVLVTCSYKEREFIRVGYYVNNELPMVEGQEEPPAFEPSKLNQVQRQILADKPRVTKFPIPWGTETVAANENTAVGGPALPEKMAAAPAPETGAAEMEVE